MLVVLGVAVVILAVAVVALFAMVAELASRIPKPAHPDPGVAPVKGALLGRQPRSWPSELPPAEHCVVLVLSTICNSCARIAAQLDSAASAVDLGDIGVLVTTVHAENGAEFVNRYRLQRFPCHVDVRGEWVSAEFGIRSSPTALVFRGGKLESAYVFNDVSAIRQMIGPRVAEQQEGQGAVV